MNGGEHERWSLSVSATATRSLRRGPPRGLPLSAAVAVGEFLYGPLLDNPRRVGKPLERELAGYYASRRGPYRVIYRIDDDKHQVHVVRIEHRADVYRPR